MLNRQTLLDSIIHMGEIQQHVSPYKFGHSTPTLEVIEGPKLSEALLCAAEGRSVSYLVTEGYRDIAFKDRRQITGVADRFERIDLHERGVYNLVRLSLPAGTALFTSQPMPSSWPAAYFTNHHHSGSLNPDYPHAIVLFDEKQRPLEFALIGSSCSRRIS